MPSNDSFKVATYEDGSAAVRFIPQGGGGGVVARRVQHAQAVHDRLPEHLTVRGHHPAAPGSGQVRVHRRDQALQTIQSINQSIYKLLNQ